MAASEGQDDQLSTLSIPIQEEGRDVFEDPYFYLPKSGLVKHPQQLDNIVSPNSRYLTMTRFSIHKNERDRWTSNPLYTHHQGYKICLRVIANGTSFGKGTHVSAFIHFMKGKYDDTLKWPFRGVIKFRLMDQLGDDHKLGLVTYDDNVADNVCTRVTEGEGEVSKGPWGYIQFIPHSDLEPKYLKEDELAFQIYEVELH